jgi:predicted nucleic acid-binding protein
VIAYFDTSALIPLIVEEAGSGPASRVWDEAERVVTVRVAYPEGRAALARDNFEDLWAQLDRVEVTAALAQRAGDLADQRALRGCDAIHVAAAETLADIDLVFVAGDGELCAAATGLGLAVART